jgi:hypothetical protein
MDIEQIKRDLAEAYQRGMLDGLELLTKTMCETVEQLKKKLNETSGQESNG